MAVADSEQAEGRRVLEALEEFGRLLAVKLARSLERQSRVASWGVRTLTGPMLAAAGVVLFPAFGALNERLGDTGVTVLRYTIISLLGGWFMYYGLKAVQLAGMSNRVWKRTAEYGLILAERNRLNR